MIDLLNIPLPKCANLISINIEYYDYPTFKKIATSSEFVQEFKGKKWETNSTKHLKKNKIYEGAIQFDFNKDFEFYDYYTLEAKIKERTDLFEAIDWKITNQLQYQSSQELYLWEIWLEQISFIDLQFAENGAF
jgi:hypothetical protein